MSNRVTFTKTRFEDILSGEITWGYRVYDSYDQIYCNLLTEEDTKKLNVKDALFIIENDHSDFIEGGINLSGLLFDNEYYTSEECEELLKEVNVHD